MSFFGWLKTSEKAVDTGLDLLEKGANGIDVLFHTDEEKAHESAATRTEFFQHVLKINELHNKSSTESSKARRKLANIITWFTMGIASYCVVIITIGRLFDSVPLETSQQLVRDILAIIGQLWIGEAFAAVVTTFFIAHGVYKARK